jgi:hypothetical protein
MKVQTVTTLAVMIGSVAAALGGASFLVSSTYGQNQTQTESAGEPVESDTVVDQRTAMSRAAVTTHPGQVKHQILQVLPIREDRKIWSGTITFTASKPVELGIPQKYNPDQQVNATHGEPFHDIAVLLNNTDVAFTILKDAVDTHLLINGITISSGTFDFAGSALDLFQSEGEQFTATYTIDAVAKDLEPLNRSATE